MAHYNFYDSLGLDRGKDAEALGKEIDQRLQSQELNDATRDELQVARRILGDTGRRKVYDTRLDDPAAPTVDVRALRQMAAAEPGPAPASGAPFGPGAPTTGFPSVGSGSTKVTASSTGNSTGADSASDTHEPSAPKRKKPKQYFPDTDPNAETVSPTKNGQPTAPGWAPGTYPTTTNIPVYQGPTNGQFPGQGAVPGGQYGFQGHNPGQPQYPYPAQQTGPSVQPVQQMQPVQPDPGAQPAPASSEAGQGNAEKKGASPWLIGAIVLVLLAIAAGGWWLWKNQGTEWSAPEQEMADTFPQIISEKDGQRGWMGMKCTSLPATNGEDARIRCSDKDLGVSIMDFGTQANRDAQLPEGDAEVIGNNVCSARSYKMEGVTPPAYRIAPEGADSQYLLLVNGGEAESKRMYLNLCEKSRG